MNGSQIEKVFYSFYDITDPRIRDKPLMGSLFLFPSMYVLYVIIIIKILPKFMENRKPLDYRKCMLLLDVFLCARSFYFVVMGTYAWFIVPFDWKCQPMQDNLESWESKIEVSNCYYFVMTKFIYTLQSVVYVVSKKKSSVGTYLLIHHSTFPVLMWIALHFYPGGHATFVGYVNAIVHFIGSSMRIISTLRPHGIVRRYAKVADVSLHIFQFVSIIIHSLQVLIHPNCRVPKYQAMFEIAGAIYIGFIYNRYVLGARNFKKED